MQVELLLPHRRVVPLEDLDLYLSRCIVAQPFDPPMMDACADLSQRIMHDGESRLYPELRALAFRIRKAELHRLREEFTLLSRVDRVLMPRGTVFHLPPRNVDTMFVYSWLMSALVGNRNVIRLSPDRSESTKILLRLFSETMANAAEPARSNTLVLSYAHEEEPTWLLSSLCDVRVIWGGDQTVGAIRRSPLAPHGKELTFPDRYAIAALHADAYHLLAERDRNQLAHRFFNDSFWFDQMACSSPRLVIWCGKPTLARDASADFFARVAAVAGQREYSLSASQSMQKLVFSAGAVLDLPVTAYRRYPELTVLTLDSPAKFDRRHSGGGMFFELILESLSDLAPMLVRRDQTLTWFGFGEDDLRTLVRHLKGRAIDRVVPIGQALQFHRFWDGNDLLQEFCRHIYFGSLDPEIPVAPARQ